MRRLAKPVRQSMLRRALHEALQAVPFHEMSSAPAMLAPENEPVLDHLSVLLVEDNMVNRTLALEMLQRLGCDAMHAGNGVEALDALEKQEFDVVLMDCQMPVMDGFIATRKLREREVAQQARADARGGADRQRARRRSRGLPRGRHERLSRQALHARAAAQHPAAVEGVALGGQQGDAGSLRRSKPCASSIRTARTACCRG